MACWQSAPVAEINAALFENAALRTANRSHTQIEIEALTQPRALLCKLIEQRTADETRTDNADRYRLGRQMIGLIYMEL